MLVTLIMNILNKYLLLGFLGFIRHNYYYTINIIVIKILYTAFILRRSHGFL